MSGSSNVINVYYSNNNHQQQPTKYILHFILLGSNSSNSLFEYN